MTLHLEFHPVPEKQAAHLGLRSGLFTVTPIPCDTCHFCNKGPRLLPFESTGGLLLCVECAFDQCIECEGKGGFHEDGCSGAVRGVLTIIEGRLP